MLKQQNSDGGKIHTGQEESIRLIIYGGDPAKPLDFLGKTLRQMVLLIQVPVNRPRIGNVVLRRDHITGPVR